MTKQYCDCCGIEMTGDAIYGGPLSNKKPLKITIQTFKIDQYQTETVFCINCSVPIEKILKAKS